MKKLLKVFVVMSMVFVLSGCMKMNMNYEVKADGTMNINMEVLVEESLLTMSGKSIEDSIKELEDQMKSNADMGDAKFSPLEKTIDGKKWAGFKVSGTAKDSSKYLQEKTIDGKESLVLTLPFKEATGGMSGGAMDPSQYASQGYTLDKLKQLGTEMNLVITMPSQPTSTVGKVDGNTVTIDMLELSMSNKKSDIVVTSAKTAGIPMGLVLGGVGAVVIVAAILIILKSKKKKAETVEVMEDVPTSVVEDTVVDGVETTSETVAEAVEQTEDIPTEVVEEAAVETVETPEETEEVKEDVEKGFCPNCGNAVESNVDYCPNCGHKLK